jgi:hypothetical protein
VSVSPLCALAAYYVLSDRREIWTARASPISVTFRRNETSEFTLPCFLHARNPGGRPQSLQHVPPYPKGKREVEVPQMTGPEAIPH